MNESSKGPKNGSLEKSKDLYSKCVKKFAIKFGPNEVQQMNLEVQRMSLQRVQ